MALEPGAIASMTLTYSWGAAPASSTITLPGDVAEFGPGDEVVVNVGSLNFVGACSGNPVTKAGTNGAITNLTVLDNRVHLDDDQVYCTFNNAEIREDDPSTPGIDRQKRYWSILPVDWDTQTKTWNSDRYKASEILDFVLNAATVDFKWLGGSHSALDTRIDAVDANNGSSVGNVLQQIASQLGILFTVMGSNQLVWARKGEGSVPSIPDSVKAENTTGEALSHTAPKVRVVGNRNLYQDMPVTMEPWWNRQYEKYLLESDWLDEVEATFGPFGSDEEGYALRAAKARAVTVREYANKKGDITFDTGWGDPGMWGEVSRMEIPVFVYVRDIIFKAYRVPRKYKCKGAGLNSIALHEGLLAAVDYDVDSGTMSLHSPREFYPSDKAFAIVQGQQLDLVDPRGHKVITDEQLAAARTKWTPNARFNLDIRPDAAGIIFDEQVFLPGEGTHGLWVFPNRGKAGIGEGDPLYNVAVPNAQVTWAPAQVKCAFTWECERMSYDFGSGKRTASHFVASLAKHAVMVNGVESEEVKYLNGKTAEEEAQHCAEALTSRQAVYAYGSFKRMGAAGTVLSGMIDRVTAGISMDGGTWEVVEFTKERVSKTYFSERQLDRQARTHDLFPGQKALRNESWMLMAQAAVAKELKRTPQTDRYRSVQHAMQSPLGAVHNGPVTINGIAGAQDAGAVLYRDAASGEFEPSGDVFGGVVVMDKAKGAVMCSTQGVVPVQVKGKFDAGDVVGVNSGNTFAQKDGDKIIGIVEASYDDTATVLAPVRLCGSKAADPYHEPFDVYIDNSGTVPVIKVQPGQINGEFPNTIGGSADWTYTAQSGIVYLKVKLAAADNSFFFKDMHFALSEDDVPDDIDGTGDGGDGTYTATLELAEVTGGGTDDDPFDVTTYYNGSRWVALVLCNVVCSAGSLTIKRVIFWG